MSYSFLEFWHATSLLAKGVLLLLLAMSALSVVVAVEKWLALARASRESRRFLAAWRAGGGTRAVPTIATLERYPHSHVAAVVAAGVRVMPHASAAQRLHALDRATRGARLAALATMRTGLGTLATVGSTAPFVGLFGTVVGVIGAFREMAVAGQGGLGVVSAGIAEALVATAAGIFVALPALWLFNFLSQRIASMGSEMECAAEEIALAVLAKGGTDGRDVE
jgi:biopolymer transport protein ExbB/TolQ